MTHDVLKFMHRGMLACRLQCAKPVSGKLIERHARITYYMSMRLHQLEPDNHQPSFHRCQKCSRRLGACLAPGLRGRALFRERGKASKA